MTETHGGYLEFSPVAARPKTSTEAAENSAICRGTLFVRPRQPGNIGEVGTTNFALETPRIVENTRIGDHAFEPLTEGARSSQQMTQHVERIDRHPLGKVQTKIGVVRGGAEQFPNLVVGSLGDARLGPLERFSRESRGF